MPYVLLWLILRKIWPLLVLDNWKVITNFLVEAVTQDLLFSGVTAFNSLSADFESRLMSRFGLDGVTINKKHFEPSKAKLVTHLRIKY